MGRSRSRSRSRSGGRDRRSRSPYIRKRRHELSYSDSDRSNGSGRSERRTVSDRDRRRSRRDISCSRERSYSPRRSPSGGRRAYRRRSCSNDRDRDQGRWRSYRERRRNSDVTPVSSDDDETTAVLNRIVMLRSIPDDLTEQSVEDAARSLAISKGFSPPNCVEIIGVSTTSPDEKEATVKRCAFIEFPSSVASRSLLKATPLGMVILQKTYRTHRLTSTSPEVFHWRGGAFAPGAMGWLCIQCNNVNDPADGICKSCRSIRVPECPSAPFMNATLRNKDAKDAPMTLKMPPKDRFVFHAESNFYYDAESGLFYDPKTQYFMTSRGGTYYIPNADGNQLVKVVENKEMPEPTFEDLQCDLTKASESDEKEKVTGEKNKRDAIANILAAVQSTAQAAKDTAKLMSTVPPPERNNKKLQTSAPSDMGAAPGVVSDAQLLQQQLIAGSAVQGGLSFAASPHRLSALPLLPTPPPQNMLRHQVLQQHPQAPHFQAIQNPMFALTGGMPPGLHPSQMVGPHGMLMAPPPPPPLPGMVPVPPPPPASADICSPVNSNNVFANPDSATTNTEDVRWVFGNDEEVQPDHVSGDDNQSSASRDVEQQAPKHQQTCYTCCRKFVSNAALQKHFSASKLHKRNMQLQQVIGSPTKAISI